MDNQENLPTKAAARNAVTLAEKQNSLIARGLAAVSARKKSDQNVLNELPPGGFDAETYRQAKPQLETILKEFQEAGKTLKDFFKFLIKNFGKDVKPYGIQFCKDMRLSARLNQKTTPKQAESRMSILEMYKMAIKDQLSQKYCVLGSRCYDSHNYDQAMSWYRTGANRGHFLSQLFLAEMYEEGRGIKDDKQAVFWFKKAQETSQDGSGQGGSGAKRGLERLGIDWEKNNAP